MKTLFITLILAALMLTGCAGDNNAPLASAPPPDETASAATALAELDAYLPDDLESVSDQSGEGGTGGVLPHDQVITPPSGDVVSINERLFIAQTNDIYINAGDYMGKTIQYEGIFKTDYWADMGRTFYYVIRYGPGCCGYDGEAGFEVAWEGDWPKEDDWCEAVGILEEYEENGWPFLRLNLTSLTVLEERGAEYVST
ncbi:MAG: hypothetical protein LBV27_02820 [Oscillospiraceae bacterium]|jgi:hypothetical protein|nr:hypothetical protein [Oscillospiraceae bacterium]